MTSERHIHTEGIGTWPWPDRVVDACFGDDFGIHAAVAGEYEHILHAEGESDIGLPASYAAECVAEVDVIKPEEGCILKEIIRVPLSGAVRGGESGLPDKLRLVWKRSGIEVQAGCGVGRGEVVEDPCARCSMAVQAEIPVPICHLDIESVKELRRRALSCHVPVPFGYHSVTVEIDELVLYRVAVRIILLLVGIVCIRSIADHLA